MNDSEVTAKQQELRKSNKSLMICGKALIAFGAWTALRVILSMLLGDNNLRSFVESNAQSLEAGGDVTVDMIIVILFIVVLVVCLIAFLINYIAGHGAYVEGKTGKKGVVYIIVTVFLLILTGYGIVGTFLPEESSAAEPENQEALIDAGDSGEALGDSGSLLMDLTQLFLCGDILFSVYKARKLSSDLGEETV